MMDLKEIIKWFIPCFHILLANLKHFRFTFICLFLLINYQGGCAANVKSVETFDTKNYSYYENRLNGNQSEVNEVSRKFPDFLNEIHQYFAPDGSVGRTFGRPFKKMVGALMPLIFQLGAASTWAVVAALVGIKTLAVTLVILKILLIAGAAKILARAEKEFLDERRTQAEYNLKLPYSYTKLYDTTSGTLGTTNDGTTGGKSKNKVPEFFGQKIGAIFGSKGHGHYPQHQAWEPPHPLQKEIHLHIHNGHHEVPHDDHGSPVYGGWSREDGTNVIDLKNTVNSYPVVGPQTIKTPYGNYIRVEDAQHPT